MDVGSGNNYKNDASSWFATKGTRYTYARVWTDNAYPQANYALNRPYGLPTCVPNHKIYTTTGTWEPDYCPVHDYILIGAGGATFTSTAGASGVTGGGGASGGSTWLQGLTTDSCCIPLDGTTSPASEVQVGVGGGGQSTANNSSMKNWMLLSGGVGMYALSGANATSTTGATAGANASCDTVSFREGTFASCASFNGSPGANGNAAAGAGGVGGGSAASLTHAGYAGATGTGSGGNGGAGTSAKGSADATKTGGAGGNNLDGTTGGTGGVGGTASANGYPGNPPGGGGGGATVATHNGAAGANGHADTEFASLVHACGNNGPGGGGGGGGGNRQTGTGTGSGANGGNGANYGGVGGGGGAAATQG